MKIEDLAIDIMEIKTDLKWVKKALEENHTCKKTGIVMTLTQKVNTNRKLIYIIVGCLLTSILGVLARASL